MAKTDIDARRRNIDGNVIKGSESSVHVSIRDGISPQEYLAFHKISPDVAKTILDMTREEQMHRHNLDNERIGITKRSQRDQLVTNLISLTYAFLIVVSFFALIAVSIYFEQPIAASVIGLIGIGALVKLFLTYRSRNTGR